MESLVIDDLRKVYPGGNVAVENISLHLGEGAFTTLLGPSGCGKTTTLRCLAGLEVPDSGRISFGEQVFVDVADGRFVAPHRRKLGMVFQSYALWPNKTVQANVSYPLRLRGTSRTAAAGRAREVLAAVGLEQYGSRYPHELSGGQQQRVALARGLISASGLLLFDEPLSNLDAKLRLSMRTEIRRLHDEFGYSSVYVTHDQEEALAISDYVVVLNDGMVEQAGTPHEIFAAPASRWVADFVGFDNLLEVDRPLPGEDRVELAGGGALTAPGERVAVRPGEYVGFRSDDVVFAGQAPADEPHYRFSGAVTASSYLGDAYRLDVRVAPGTEVVATLPDASRRQVPEKYLGEQLELAVPVARTITLT